MKSITSSPRSSSIEKGRRRSDNLQIPGGGNHPRANSRFRQASENASNDEISKINVGEFLERLGSNTIANESEKNDSVPNVIEPTDEPRYMYRISGKVTEAKNLCMKKPAGNCEFFFEGKTDREQKPQYQSPRSTQESPYWIEEFVLDSDSPFKDVKIVLWMASRETEDDTWMAPIGKVVIPRNAIKADQDEWYPLLDASLEENGAYTIALISLVSGTAKFKIKYMGEKDKRHEFNVKLSECFGLGNGVGTICPSAEMCVFPDPTLSSYRNTNAIARTANPFFNETFTFFISNSVDPISMELYVSFWDTKKTGSTFLGNVFIPLGPLIEKKDYFKTLPLVGLRDDSQIFNIINLSKINGSNPLNYGKELATLLQQPPKRFNLVQNGHMITEKRNSKNSLPETCCECHQSITSGALYSCSQCSLTVHGDCKDKILHSCGTKGSIRIKMAYTKFLVLGSESYSGMIDSLKRSEYLLLRILGKISPKREEAAKLLVKIFDASFAEFLAVVLRCEIMESTDSKTLFRANSMASKALDVYMKHEGASFLQHVLEPVLKQIVARNCSFELDPTRLDPQNSMKPEDLEKIISVNSENMIETIALVSTAIFTSVSQMPVSLQSMFGVIQEAVKEKFPEEPLVRYTSVSGFLFLRFFNPAIMAPNSYKYDVGFIGDNTKRKFTLIAKTLQNLGNLTEFGKKETYMQSINPFIIQSIPVIKEFIDQLSEPIEFKPISGNYSGATISTACSELRDVLHNCMEKFMNYSPALPDDLVIKLGIEIDLIKSNEEELEEEGTVISEEFELPEIGFALEEEKGDVKGSQGFLSRLVSYSKSNINSNDTKIKKDRATTNTPRTPPTSGRRASIQPILQVKVEEKEQQKKFLLNGFLHKTKAPVASPLSSSLRGLNIPANSTNSISEPPQTGSGESIISKAPSIRSSIDSVKSPVAASLLRDAADNELMKKLRSLENDVSEWLK